jgi:hypothetical protein
LAFRSHLGKAGLVGKLLRADNAVEVIASGWKGKPVMTPGHDYPTLACAHNCRAWPEAN